MERKKCRWRFTKGLVGEAMKMGVEWFAINFGRVLFLKISLLEILNASLTYRSSGEKPGVDYRSICVPG